MNYFNNPTENNIYSFLFCVLIVSEFMIWLMTSSPFSRKRIGNSADKKRSDKGSVWFIVIGYWLSIFVSYMFAGKNTPLRLPNFFYYAGIVLMVGGIILRVYSVFTLKKAFTLSVQTTKDQHLIKTGPYKLIRNPAYTGSIISLLGIAFALRGAFAPIPVLIICIICYNVRINVEEKALREQFKSEFDDYCSHTYRLFPFIY